MFFPRRSIKFTVVAVIQTFKNNECIRHCCVAWPQRIQIIPTCLHHYCESLQHSCMSVNGENRNWASRLKKKTAAIPHSHCLISDTSLLRNCLVAGPSSLSRLKHTSYSHYSLKLSLTPQSIIIHHHGSNVHTIIVECNAMKLFTPRE
jgi:hypothetical protein